MVVFVVLELVTDQFKGKLIFILVIVATEGEVA